MKRHLANLARVLVSAGILMYLGLRILQDETESALEPLAARGGPSVTVLAETLGVSAAQLERVRSLCAVADPQQPGQQVIRLGRLPWGERLSLIRQVGPQGLHQAFGQIRFVWFLLAVACMGVVVVLGVVRWQSILRVQGLELPFRRVCSINFIGLFFNAFMLGATGGDVMKAWYVAHETHHKKAEAVATVIVDRVIGLLVLFVIALTMMLLFWHRVFDDPRLRTFLVFTVVVVAGTVGVTAVGLWKGFADRFPGLRRVLQKIPKYDTLRRMVDAYRVYTSHPGVLGR
ncbi:flippase-like domain-containing protein, partial [bacterium]|nr:flippase-like domain-containing protein [bacterium]